MSDLPNMNPALVDEKTAARYIGFSCIFLRKSRSEGKREGHADAPRFLRIGRSIRYAVEDLDAWIAAHRQETR